MSEIKQPSPPGTGWDLTEDGDLPSMVAVRLKMPGWANCESLTPPGNRIGLVLLSHLLKAQIEAEGLRCFQETSGGELNDGIILLDVSEVFESIAVVRRTIEESGMFTDPFTTIGYYCRAELIWRCVYPNSGVEFDITREVKEVTEKFKAQLGRARAEHARNMAFLREIARRQKKEPEEK